MKKSFIIPFFPVLLSIILIQKIVVLSGCATIVPPSGGFRDSLPPVLVKANPKDSVLNFRGNKITFSFDEFVELQNVQQNLIITPIPQNNPMVEARLNTVTVKLKDSLETNTTYTLNFGNAIQDITEKNVLKNFTYRFSTGPAMDSLKLSGKVILAETGKPDTALIVMLHKNGKDSAVMNEKPRYVTRVNQKGEFTFQNLPAATYYIYAVAAQAGSYNYYGRDQLFAFTDKPVIIQQKTDSITLYAFAEKAEERKKASSIPSAGGGRKLPNVSGADKRLKYQTSLKDNKQDLLENFSFKFETPIKYFDSTKIYFSTDTGYIAVREPFHWILDSTKTKAELKTILKENIRYNLIFDIDFAEDTLGHHLLKKDTISFSTRQKASYGELKINFKNIDLAKNPVLQFIQNNSVVLSAPLITNQYASPLFNPGDYELRILFDENKNGIWDPGEFFGKRKQPELVRPIERKLTIKPNWQNEFDITL